MVHLLELATHQFHKAMSKVFSPGCIVNHIHTCKSALHRPYLVQSNHSTIQCASSTAIKESLFQNSALRNTSLHGGLTAVSGDINTKILVLNFRPQVQIYYFHTELKMSTSYIVEQSLNPYMYSRYTYISQQFHLIHKIYQ